MTRPISMSPRAAPPASHPLVPRGDLIASGARRSDPAEAPGYEQPLPREQPTGEAAHAASAPRRGAGDLAREQAHTLLAALEAGGLRHLVISSGSRSTPLTLAAAERAELPTSALVLHDLVDERSAAFFALGLARATGVAPALICTSGSAAAHYHPAVLEAAHALLPLLVLSADRPPEAQGRGAHQTIDQAALFWGLCRATETLGLPDGHPDTLRGVAHLGARALHQTRHPLPGPVHLVAPFRKPLEPSDAPTPLTELALPLAPRFFAGRAAPDPAALSTLRERCARTERGLIVAGPLTDLTAPARAAFWRLAEATGFPVIAEAGSQLRLDGEARPTRLDAFPVLLSTGEADALAPELILRLGAEPSSLGFAAWLGRQAAEVWILAEHLAADGENRGAAVIEGDLGATLTGLAEGLAPGGDPTGWLEAWQAADGAAGERREARLADERELSEAAILRAALASLPDPGAHLVLGNSLPIRMADLCGPGSLARARVHTQRGTSGIDGTVAGAAGIATATGEAVTCVLGDLSLAHDLGSLGLAASAPAPVTLVVPNNGGGRIFELLPAGRREALTEAVERHLVMPGPASFEHAAAHFGLAYHRAQTLEELERILAKAPTASRLIEAVVPPHAARDFLAGLECGRRGT